MSQPQKYMYGNQKILPLETIALVHVVFHLADAFVLPDYRSSLFGRPLLRRSPPRQSTIRAGLPGYSTWFRQEFSDAYITRKETEEFEHVYVDLQQEIHAAGRNANNDVHAIKLLYWRLNSLMRSIGQVGRSVLIAADGTGPAAKLLTQRARRRQKKAPDTDDFNPLKIGAGTAFMTKIHDAMVSYGKERSKQYPNVFVIDGPLVPGEGEVKLLGHFYENAKTFTAHHESSTEPLRVRRHVFVSGDSDLILMAIIGYARVGLSDAQHFGSTVAHDVLLSDFDPKNNKFFSASKLASNIGNHLFHAGVTANASVPLRALLDLALIAIMARGNDYLPSLGGCGGISLLWQTYLDRLVLEARRGAEKNVYLVSLPEDDSQVKISWGAVTNLTGAVYEKLSANFTAKTKRKHQKQLEQSSQKLSEHRLRSNVKLYMNALQWNLNMYAVGRCLDYRFGPIPEQVSREDLSLFAQILETDPPESQDSRIGPLLPAIYNLLMQPLGGRSLVAPAIRSLMDEGSPIRWLYSRGCRCAECYRLYSEALPFRRVIQSLSPRTDEAMTNEYNKAQAQLKPIEEALRAHQLATHDGVNTIFRELPSLLEVEKLARAAHKMERDANSTSQSSADERNERSWMFLKPQWFVGSPRRQSVAGSMLSSTSGTPDDATSSARQRIGDLNEKFQAQHLATPEWSVEQDVKDEQIFRATLIMPSGQRVQGLWARGKRRAKLSALELALNSKLLSSSPVAELSHSNVNIDDVSEKHDHDESQLALNSKLLSSSPVGIYYYYLDPAAYTSAKIAELSHRTINMDGVTEKHPHDESQGDPKLDLAAHVSAKNVDGAAEKHAIDESQGYPKLDSVAYASAKIAEKFQRGATDQWEGKLRGGPNFSATLWRLFYENGGINAFSQMPFKSAIVPVSEIRFSHDFIRSTFTNGEHEGESIEQLIDGLLSGSVDPLDEERLCLNVLRFNGVLVSFNNRRLYALKEYQRRIDDGIVHARTRILQLDASAVVAAKFALSYSTKNEGTSVEVHSNPIN